MNKKTVKYNKTGPSRPTFTLPRDLYDDFTAERLSQGMTKDRAAEIAFRDWIKKEKGD